MNEGQESLSLPGKKTLALYSPWVACSLTIFMGAVGVLLTLAVQFSPGSNDVIGWADNGSTEAKAIMAQIVAVRMLVSFVGGEVGKRTSMD